MTDSKALLISLAVALIAGGAGAVLMLEHITVRAGEETAAVVKMWPALLWSVTFFALSFTTLRSKSS